MKWIKNLVQFHRMSRLTIIAKMILYSHNIRNGNSVYVIKQ
jgi:hypothetical protein